MQIKTKEDAYRILQEFQDDLYPRLEVKKVWKDRMRSSWEGEYLSESKRDLVHIEHFKQVLLFNPQSICLQIDEHSCTVYDPKGVPENHHEEITILIHTTTIKCWLYIDAKTRIVGQYGWEGDYANKN